MKKTLFVTAAVILLCVLLVSCNKLIDDENSKGAVQNEASLTDLSVPLNVSSYDVSVDEENSDAEISVPHESNPSEDSKPEESVPEESVLEESTVVEKYVWYGESELKSWFSDLKEIIDNYEPREDITDDGMRSDHFTTIPSFFIDYLNKYEEKVFDYDYVPKFGACGDANIAALAEYYDISKEEYKEFCNEYLQKWGRAPDGEKPYGLEIYMLNWDAWFSEEYWEHPDFVFSDYDSERYDCYYTSVPDRGDYTRRYYRIDYALIQYVGEEHFQKWLDEKEDKDQNILDFIEYFEITREQYDKLYKDYFPIPYNPDYLFGTPEMQDEYFKVHPLN